jgi:WD40 repeat protein
MPRLIFPFATHKSLSLFIALVGVFSLVGCGGGSPAPPPALQAKPEAPPKAAEGQPDQANTPPSVEPKETTKPAEVNSKTAASETKPESKSQTKPAATSVKQVIKPTEAQIAKWQRTPFESFQLLDCRDPESLNLVTHVADAHDGKHFILAGRKVILFSVDPKEPEQVLYECQGEQEIKSLAVSPDGKWFALGDSAGMLRILSSAEKKELASKKIGSNDIVQLAISPDSQEIAATSYDGVVTVWSPNPIEKKKEFKPDSGSYERLAYMAPGVLVAAGEKMVTWNTATGEQGEPITKGRYSFTLSPTPDSVRFAFVDEDKLHLWNIAESKSETTLLGAFASKELLAFSTDGKWIASAGGNSVRIWDRASRQPVQYIDAIGDPISGLCWLPQTDLLVVVSITGRIRTWGPPKAGEAIGLKPLHAPITPLAKDSKEPVTPAQFFETIDLRSFPTLPDCQGRFSYPYMVDYTANVPKEEAQTFYRYQLGKAGWQEVIEKSNVPNAIEFRKNGLWLLAMFSGSEPSKTDVSINISSNYDVRLLPKFAGAPLKKGYEAHNQIMYLTKADLLTIETELLKKMHEAGWTCYARLNASSSEEDDKRSFDFVQNGVQLVMSIGKFPNDPESYTIQASTQMSLNGIPIPKDSGFVEFDGSTDPKLVALTSMNLDEAAEFYDKKLAEQGWLPRKHRKSEKGDRHWLNYIRGQNDLMVGLVKQENGRTLVRIGEGLENASWQLAKPDAKAETENAPVGIEAADFPILNDSKTAKFDAIGKSIEIEMPGSSLVEAADKYLKAMKDLGWAQDGAGIKDEEFVLMTFKKDQAEFAIRGRKAAGKVTLNVQGDQLLWTKDLPGGKQTVSYETWLRTNRHPTGLDLLEKYEKEMRAILNAKKP